MKFPFLFKTSSAAATTSWQWPACVNNPKTPSFRANPSEDIYKTMNSAYLAESTINPETSFFEIDPSAVVRGLRSSDRLFFEPGETNSILEEARLTGGQYDYDFPYKESTVSILAMDSRDPFSDFRASMEEMVEAHGLKDWECLQELLACYLRVNGRSNHGYVIGAFVDLLLHLSLQLAPDSSSSSSSKPAAIHDDPAAACSSSSNTTLNYSLTSPLSFSSSTYNSSICSPCLSSLQNEDELIVVEKVVNGCSSSSSTSSGV
ncbi:transcription repressor OFP15-like [Henckelia pumila]|uniref:transcription repressor OFP15-like n=1 Tax=Henckelia pumila TaxID=405737 RepID=UPI003C6E3547